MKAGWILFPPPLFLAFLLFFTSFLFFVYIYIEGRLHLKKIIIMTQKKFLSLIGWLAAPKLQANSKNEIVKIINKENNKIILQNKITKKIYEVCLSPTEKYLIVNKNSRVRALCLNIVGGQEIRRAFYNLIK